MGGEAADLVFTDPPFNCVIDGYAGGSGKAERREFVMASGEMTPEAFEAFLKESLGAAAQVSADGALHYVFMDWKGLRTLLGAAASIYSEQKNLIVWAKTNAGMGSFYRSQHELIGVFKVGAAPHRNNFRLGETGRYRTNVWTYPGMNSFGADRDGALAMHPTVKPVALVADAMRDVTRRRDIVLDPFGGSGTTLIAAQRTGRRARLLELDPLYCDVICRRWRAFSGSSARLEADGLSFDEVAQRRIEAGDE
jgi:DNA modification methylase